MLTTILISVVWTVCVPGVNIRPEKSHSYTFRSLYTVNMFKWCFWWCLFSVWVCYFAAWLFLVFSGVMLFVMSVLTLLYTISNILTSMSPHWKRENSLLWFSFFYSFYIHITQFVCSFRWCCLLAVIVSFPKFLYRYWGKQWIFLCNNFHVICWSFHCSFWLFFFGWTSI